MSLKICLWPMEARTQRKGTMYLIHSITTTIKWTKRMNSSRNKNSAGAAWWGGRLGRNPRWSIGVKSYRKISLKFIDVPDLRLVHFTGSRSGCGGPDDVVSRQGQLYFISCICDSFNHSQPWRQNIVDAFCRSSTGLHPSLTGWNRKSSWGIVFPS